MHINFNLTGRLKVLIRNYTSIGLLTSGTSGTMALTHILVLCHLWHVRHLNAKMTDGRSLVDYWVYFAFQRHYQCTHVLFSMYMATKLLSDFQTYFFVYQAHENLLLPKQLQSLYIYNQKCFKEGRTGQDNLLDHCFIHLCFCSICLLLYDIELYGGASWGQNQIQIRYL